MSLTVHPIAVHFPIALSVLVPLLCVIILVMIWYKKIPKEVWFIALFFQGLLVASGYVALETGEEDEEVVEKVLSEKLIHEHEEEAEIFVGSTVIIFVLSALSFFAKEDYHFRLKIAVTLLSFISPYLAYRTGHLGGEMVYLHGAASAYRSVAQEGLLPTPGLNTSESEMPVNESVKLDENDYGQASAGEEEAKEED